MTPPLNLNLPDFVEFVQTNSHYDYCGEKEYNDLHLINKQTNQKIIIVVHKYPKHFDYSVFGVSADQDPKIINNKKKDLMYWKNYLTLLPKLPDGLKILNCHGNQLNMLPELPDSLSELYCSNNQLTVLPDLPSGLFELYCLDNKITWLPELPTGLI